MTKVSVLMPVYNGENFLKDAIDSILIQSYTNWELIVINDGSNDKSESIINEYTDKRIRYIKNDQNIGLIATLNKGIDLCNGKYIARMDADDVSMPERLQKQIEFLENNPQIALCGTNAIVVDEKNEGKNQIINLTSNEYLQINLLFSVPFVHPSIMIRTGVLKELRYDDKYEHAEDYDLWCRIANTYQVSNIPSSLLRYRWHTTNVSVKNAQIQEDTKDKIISRQLKQLGLEPTKEELYLHRVSFAQYDVKENKTRTPFNKYKELELWFFKIITANNEVKRYNKDALIAYLWSRWIVLCISQKKYSKLFNPGFKNFNIRIYRRTIKLILFLTKKS